MLDLRNKVALITGASSGIVRVARRKDELTPDGGFTLNI
jgi:short-subunit dehydrogenase